MNKINKGEFIRSLKMFCVTFLFSIIIGVILPKILYSHNHINLSDLFIFAFAISIGSSIGYLKRYKKYTTKIMYEKVIDKDIIIELQKIMKKMHWSIKKNNSKQIIFKSSIFMTFLIEYLAVTINKNDLELVGPQYYVEKVVRKLKA